MFFGVVFRGCAGVWEMDVGAGLVPARVWGGRGSATPLLRAALLKLNLLRAHLECVRPVRGF